MLMMKKAKDLNISQISFRSDRVFFSRAVKNREISLK